jgi:hypothetical protein
MTVVVSGGSGTIASNGNQVQMDQAVGPMLQVRVQHSHIYTSSTVAGTTYYRVLINAANNGCDQAVSNNAVAVITLIF